MGVTNATMLRLGFAKVDACLDVCIGSIAATSANGQYIHLADSARCTLHTVESIRLSASSAREATQTAD
jgi:hypothetical protein